jgi:hypothetical protein
VTITGTIFEPGIFATVPQLSEQLVMFLRHPKLCFNAISRRSLRELSLEQRSAANRAI